MGAVQAWKYRNHALNVNICILDTGVYMSHPDFLLNGTSIIRAQHNPYTGVTSTSPQDPSVTALQEMHGTAAAGMIGTLGTPYGGPMRGPSTFGARAQQAQQQQHAQRRGRGQGAAWATARS